MHFVTGGAYNGKRKWVTGHYGLANRSDSLWLSAYPPLKADILSYRKVATLDTLAETEGFQPITVIEGLERFIQQLLAQEKNDDLCRERWRSVFHMWRRWEIENNQRRIVIIGTDVGKGVVPVERSLRRFRDYVGWCYQDITDFSKRVDVIWYGVANTLKMEGK
ncbi:adenosylcobinamide kinase /adenosylcobinamide-phosphate guanylyltransferase [Scopulibacillus darangshiensis]|uniref:Adenosylcobinamide kinase /adenosylcobinamide-phosphate guanylyltransferase n=1 Tax=Scopulibacillus darangshiensis TaxID=442528 RepID=A0A4R2P8H3_9BACL|nr:bifunctional adenosylcobinamide kinase/adenosylcobinamide-phosphate guanylyltransferase [Scopulibacillus darangshiensis]TCP31259.1 adenosylcobinamide kinase /adenosylcobinamide-phosphate guanylyltransferase [Scopulibacillus darangshiensis]